MKKIKKFKILEAGRICSLEEAELSKIKGGSCSSYQNCLSFYGHCTIGMVYYSCEINTSLSGFVSSGSDVYCDSGYTYTQCTSGLPLETCPSIGVYSTFK